MNNPIITKWKNIIEQIIMPKINEIGETLEGNIFSLDTTTTYYDFFKKKQLNIINCGVNLKPNSKILEIGFNSGFSALLLLLASDASITITCVDINCHSYTIPCYNLIKDMFGDRIELIVGDSNDILPELHDKYDLIHIDGCHFTEIANIDIQNSLKLINPNGVMIMDDTDFEDLGKLWNDYVLKYNMIDVDFPTEKTIFHSIKKIPI